MYNKFQIKSVAQFFIFLFYRSNKKNLKRIQLYKINEDYSYR